MLQSLRIRNLALIEEVALDFEAGFTAVTGETGAGKSILLGALSLLAGERADKTIIRQGAAACEAEASLFFVEPKKSTHCWSNSTCRRARTGSSFSSAACRATRRRRFL